MSTRRKRNQLVRNEDAGGKQVHLTCNFLAKMARHDTMEGRDYLVVPMVILTEGVHNGSEGALYYPPSELGKTPAVWNHKPLVVYHPEINGQGVSACDPNILTTRKVGLMMNTKFEGGRLKSEAWLEQDRANKVDERIMKAVENNEMMEVSTGVFVDTEIKEGDWKGEKYVGIARNYRPDHLAILPDKIGACSIADGAGLMRNQSKKGLDKVSRLILQKAGLLENEMSFDNVRSDLCAALGAKFNPNSDVTKEYSYYVVDVYSNFCVYEDGGKLYRIGYTATDTGVTLSDAAPVEVNRVTEYRTVEGAFVGNQDQTKNDRTAHMDKKKLVDAIIGNTASGWSETDRTALMALSEDQLKRMTPKEESNVINMATVVANTPKPNAGESKANYLARCATIPNTDKAVCNAMFDKVSATEEKTKEEPAPSKIVSMEEYVNAAPGPVREVLNHSLSVYNEEKDRLVAAILSNKANRFTKEDLQARPLGELRNVAHLAGVFAAAPQRQADYSGQGNVPITDNSADTEGALEMPVMNFTKAAAAAK